MRVSRVIPGLLSAAIVLVCLQPDSALARGPGHAVPAARQALVGQPAAPPAAPPSRAAILRVFLDCPDGDCDYDFLRQEITFVNIVRDRKDADIHVLVTSQRTGGGGWDCAIHLMGLNGLEKREQLVHYVTRSTDTADETRKGFSRMLKLGLVQFVTDLPVAGELDLVHKRPTVEAQTASRGARDPWNSWVFSTNLSAGTSGASSQGSANFSGGFSANRTTEAWKISASVNGYYSSTHYTFDDGSEFTSLSRDFGADGLVVKSVGTHWSAGFRASAGSSTYSNQRFAARLAPAIEYDVFPYAESTRRQLTFNYSVGLDRFAYRDVTIYDKLHETLVDHKLQIAISLKQPWGGNSTSFEFSQYLNDMAKHHIDLYNYTNVRLFRGFSLNVSAMASRIRDQIYLPKGEATPEEVLASMRQLATSYRYRFSVGFSYRFGSVFNNVVNPRFGGSTGGIMYF